MKRVMERSIEDALQTLRKIPPPFLQHLTSENHRRLVQVVLRSQLDAVNTSTSACRKLDQVKGRLCTASVLRVIDVIDADTIRVLRSYTRSRSVLEQMLQHLAQVSESLVFEEVQQCLQRRLHQEQVREKEQLLDTRMLSRV